MSCSGSRFKLFKVRFKTGKCFKLLKGTKLIDFIKIIVQDLTPSKLEANPLLDFFDNINLNTGQIRTTNRQGQSITPYRNAFYNGLEFKIYDTGLITVTGSLHKYWNAGAHNFNDFSYTSFLSVVKDLKTKFGIKAENSIIKCLEIGVNVVPPIPTNDFLDYCFLHKTKPFEYQKNSDEGKYKQVQHSQYLIKIYNKALHYTSQGFTILSEILRFEIKYLKMQKLNEKGIYTLSDLAEHKLINFKNDLLIEFQNILFYDTSIRSETKSLNNYKNPLYWIELLSNTDKNLFKYHRNNLKKITAETSDKVQFQLTEIMSKKIDFLNTDTTQIDPLIIRSNRVVCIVTNINISMQKNDSILLSHTGLRYYHKTDKKVFQQLKRKYLSKQWQKADFETQIKEIAHNIRNARSNQSIKQKKLYRPQQYNLLTELL